MIETENFVQFSRNNLPLATDNQRFLSKAVFIWSKRTHKSRILSKSHFQTIAKTYGFCVSRFFLLFRPNIFLRSRNRRKERVCSVVFLRGTVFSAFRDREKLATGLVTVSPSFCSLQSLRYISFCSGVAPVGATSCS